MSDFEHDEDLAPKFFMTPDIYIDVLMPLLTPEEFMVLMFAVRRTLGFRKRQDRISLSQFCTGTIKYGEAKDDGTGLSVNTVRNALKKLELYRILTKIDDNNPPLNEGVMYRIQFSSKVIDWAGLEKRYEEWGVASSKRVAKATETRRRMNPLSYDDIGGVSSDDTPLNDQNSDQKNDSEANFGGSSDDRGGDRPTITQYTEEKQLKGNVNQSSMHGTDSQNSEPQLTQTGMNGWMDDCYQNPNFLFLRDCGVMNNGVAKELMVLPRSTLEYQWALVKKSSIEELGKPGLLVSNLRKVLAAEVAKQRAAAERAANPEAAQMPIHAHADANRYQRPDFITEAEWNGLSDIPAVYALLDGAQFDGGNGIECRTPQQTDAFYRKHDGANVAWRFAAIRNWRPDEDE